MKDPAAGLREMFRDEARSRVERAVEGLLALERGDASIDTIAHVLRQFHSIKGSAGMMGFDDVYAIAHAAEDVLAEARDGGSLQTPVIEPLLGAADALLRSLHGDGDAAAAAVRELALSRSAGGSTESRPGVAETAGAAPNETPVRSIRMEATKVDRLLDAVGEAVLHHRRLEHVVRARVASTGEDLLDRGELLLGELQDAVIGLRALPLASITGPLPRAIRDLAVRHDKAVDLEIRGAETQLDRVVLDGLAEPLSHLLRNAVAHGIEPTPERERAGKPARGRITLFAEPRGDRVLIAVGDDGRGVAPELIARAEGRSLEEVLTEPGLSTAPSVTDLAGRGVGLDAVRRDVEALGGSVRIESRAGAGTTVTLVLPVTLALLHVLLVERAGSVLGVPVGAVSEVVSADERLSLGGRAAIEVRDAAVPLLDLAEALGDTVAPAGDGAPAIVLAASGRRAALTCDRVIGDEEVVVKSLGTLLAATPGYLGGTILGDGRVALVVDPAHVVHARARSADAPSAPREVTTVAKVLVVDDQFTVRELQRSILEVAGYRVETARTGREAWDLLAEQDDVELVITDIEMPEMDGLQLLGAIRRSPVASSLPVVVLTSRSGDDDERRGLEAGADAYIVKERFGQEALLETVRRLVGR